MKRKVFVSYKYSDHQVQGLDIHEDSGIGRIHPPSRARDYVDVLSKRLIELLHIYKGEDDDESLEDFARSTIGSKLADKIFDSSVTLVLISKGMKDPKLLEKEQWMPWEISYSLKEQSRDNSQRSKTNGIIAVVLPDENGSYEYYITQNEQCGSRTLNTTFLFEILSANMFNTKNPKTRECNGQLIYAGDSSYIQSVKWGHFIQNPTQYIDKAIEMRDRRDDFKLRRNLK